MRTIAPCSTQYRDHRIVKIKMLPHIKRAMPLAALPVCLLPSIVTHEQPEESKYYNEMEEYQ
jgi:hypothetical protein